MNMRIIETIPEQDKVIETALERMLRKSREKALKEAGLPVYDPPKKVAEWVMVKDAESSTMDYSPTGGLSAVYESETYRDQFDSEDSPESVEEESLHTDNWVEDSQWEEERNESYSDFLGIPPENESGLVDPNIVLDESQIAAVEAILDKQYSCLIGAAGTGKTTTTKALVKELIYNKNSGFKANRVGGKLNIAFVAFTGMATQVIKQNLPSWLHPNVKTIHSLLEFIPQEVIRVDKTTGQTKVTMPFLPSRTEENKLDEDCIIIDESSMVGLDLWNQLRVACKPGTRIIMIGDLNQLPPIIGEPIFAYALGQWHVSALTHVHRQTGNAGKIVEIAHEVLNGRYFADKISGKNQVDSSASKLDPMGLDKSTLATNAEWRVAGAMLPNKIKEASPKLLGTLNMLRKVTHPDGTPVYDPFRDRIMTAGNGYDENKESALMQQGPINDAFSLIIQPATKDNPRFIIDGGRVQRHFAVGNRVMATRNESPSKIDRVTNGMTGIIRKIIANGEYTGKKSLFGPEDEVQANIRRQFELLESNKYDAATGTLEQRNSLEAAAMFEAIDLDDAALTLEHRLTNADDEDSTSKADRDTWSSHTVTVEFANGAVREFWAKTGIESLQLAYASTVAKCQGSQFPTAIIVVHEAQKEQMSREWLYTAITRAQSHVIILYTEFALRFCLSKQKIQGRTLQEKIDRYREMFEGVGGPMGGLMRKNVVLEVG